VELRLGSHAVGRALHDPGRHLTLESCHAHLEELVQVATTDRQELEPLQERGAVVQRLVQHAAIELQPGQLAIDVERWVPQVERGWGGGELQVGHTGEFTWQNVTVG
jgi:hypothetical protein